VTDFSLFQIVKCSLRPQSLLSLSLVDDDDPSLVIQAHVAPDLLLPNQRLYRVTNMRRRLDSRFEGLLEVAPVRIKEDVPLTESDAVDSSASDGIILKDLSPTFLRESCSTRLRRSGVSSSNRQGLPRSTRHLGTDYGGRSTAVGS
jgi:hypothetical protein